MARVIRGSVVRSRVAALAMLLGVMSGGVSVGAAWGQANAGGGGGKAVTLPYSVADATGNTWMLYGNGMIQQQNGNAPVFSQLAQLTINGQSFPMRGGQQGRQDEKTQDIIIENLPGPGVSVTRRVLILKDDNACRYVDTFRNTTPREAVLNVQYSVNMNFGIQASRMITDPKKKDVSLAWAGLTHAGRAVYLAWGFTGGKATPKIQYADGSNVVQVTYSLTVGPGQSASLLHAHGTTETLERGAEAVAALRPMKLLAGLPGEVRRAVLNAPRSSGASEELELLRGDLLDVVEVRNGDQLRGTLKDATYPLKTAFGRLELPAAKVLAVLSVGRQRPLQLLVTDEGEIFGGQPERDHLSLQLSSGQQVKVPFAQVTRAGYRLRPSEPEEIVLSKPALTLRTGERMAIATPAQPIELASRYGVLRLSPGAVAEAALKSEETPVHVVTLTDGSRLSGILTAASVDVTLDGAAGQVALSVPLASVARLRPTALRNETDGGAAQDQPELRCAGGDVLRGTIDGAFQLDTPFETLEIRGDQVRLITRADGASADLTVTLWDQTVVTGQPRAPQLSVKLASGMTLAVPVDLIEGYVNSAPRPSDEMAVRVKELVARLNDDDFKARESAQQSLVTAGASIIPLLRELKGSQPPEARQRIEQILSQLEK